MRTLERVARALDAGLEVRFVRAAIEPAAQHTAQEVVEVLAPLFWDRELRVSDLSEHPAWVLGRVLMYGQYDQVRVGRSFFGDDAIATAIERREVDARTRNYWRLVMGDSCTRKS